MAEVGVEFASASQSGGDGSSDNEQEHLNEIPSLFPDSILDTSRDIGYANDLLSDELYALSGDEFLSETEEYALPEEMPQDPLEEPPRKKVRCLDTAASAPCTEETAQGPRVEEHNPAVLERLGLSEYILLCSVCQCAQPRCGL